MNPQGVYNISGNAPPYSLAEIWPFNGGSGGVCAPSINAADDLAASINRKMNMSLNVNLEIPNPIDNRVRRRQDEDPCGASTSRDVNMDDCTGKRMKTASELNENSKEEGEEKKTKVAEQMAKSAEPPPKQDYIHVRARRGQATDNHSLAERARREKISEKMKTLQDLVPGCNKVIGKAVVLDEIINYVQSLQRQVEFLSMKLEAVTSRQGTEIEGFPLKDFGQQQFDSSGMPFDPHSSRNYGRGASPEWLHMQIGGGFDIKRETR